MRIIAFIEDEMGVVAFDPNRKNYLKYHRTKGLFNKKSMRIIKRKKKQGKKTAMQKFCRGKLDDSCIMRAMKSTDPKLKKSANFIQTMGRIAGRKVGSKDKNNMTKRKRADVIYDRKNKQQLRRINRARIIGNKKARRWGL